MSARVPSLEPEEWSDDVRALLGDTLGPVAGLEGEGGRAAADLRPLNILTVIARQPRLLAPFLAWAATLALDGALSRRDHELLALRTAFLCRSPFEWAHHAVYARGVGLTDDEIDRVAAGPDAGWPDGEAALLRAADGLHGDSTIGDPTWEALAARYELDALVEVCFVVGQYTMLSMVANATGVKTEPGLDPLPEDAGT